MQRYRVNYRLLIGLVVGSLVATGAAYGMWRFQIDRNATDLLAKADVAEEKGDVAGVFKSLDQYVRLRTDETEPRIRLGKAAAEYVTEKDLDMNERSDVFNSLVAAVINTDDAELRRKLVDLQMQFNQADRALQNIDDLLDGGHGDAELKALKAECLFATQQSAKAAAWCYKLIGYDQKTDTFDMAKAEAPQEPLPYARLAQYLRGNRQPELSGRVLDQMIAANPESREALVLHYQFLKAGGEQERARAALEKAYELDPTDAAVLTFKGAEAAGDYQTEMAAATGADAEAMRTAANKHLESAAGFFADALERYPDRIDLYGRVAQLDLMREKPEDAMAVIDRGLRKFPLKEYLNRLGIPVAIDLANTKIDLLLSQQKFDDAAKQIKSLRDLNNTRVGPLAEYHEAHVAAIKEQWADAAKKLNAVKVRLLNFPDLQAKASAIQGFCHVQLAQHDLAEEAYDWALKKNPDLPQAVEGKRQMTQLLHPDSPADESLDLDRRIREMIAAPADQQDWPSIEALIDAQIEQQAKRRPPSETWVEARKKLLRGQVLAMRAATAEESDEKTRLFLEARERIGEALAIDPNDPDVQEHAVRLIALEPDGGPAKALAQLDSIVAKNKDTLNFRLLRIELLAALRDEQLPSQLDAATEGIEEWPPGQQARVWAAVASQFERLGKFSEATRSLEKAVELSPNSLPMRMALFETALKQGDDAAMRSAQQKILEMIKNPSDPDYVLTEVKRRIVGFERGSVSQDELQEARPMLEQAIKQRSTFADLYVANGQLWMILEKNPERALESLDKALQYGPANLNAVNLQVRLLAERGRWQEAHQKMDRIPSNLWAPLLDQVAAAVLVNVGDTDRAFTEAEKVAQARPDNDRTQLWFAEIAAEAEEFKKAEEALQKAVAINPNDPDLWTRLVSLYLQMKQPDDVERTLREAHLALDAEFLPLLTGKYYELQSRWQEAEDIYLSAYSSKLDEPGVSRRLAEFYMTWSAKDEANRGKAAIQINRILRAANEGKIPADDPHAAWARQQAAQMLALTNDYQNSLKAEQVLTAGREEPLAGTDREFLIDVLNKRGDPASRERAADLLRQMQQEQRLQVEREIQLGQTLNELGEWAASKEQMQDAILRHPDDPRLLTAYASMLIARRDFEQAERYLERLAEFDDMERPLAELQLRMAAGQGEKDKLRTSLESITPDLVVLTDEQLQTVRSVAQLAESMGDVQYALKLMREYSRRSSGKELELTRYVTRYGPIDEGLDMLATHFDGHIDEVASMAIEMLRARRSEAPEKMDEVVGRLVRQALRDDPESARRMVFEAEMMEIQERYDESVVAYDKLLAREDVPKVVRAAAQNNLAFILALKRQDLDRALQIVDEAIEVIGPISDILDTRALVYIARGEFDKAVEDMELAVKMVPTAGKYFHLTAAQLGAGDEQAALDAWKQAEAQGIEPAKVSKLERDELKQLGEKINALRTSTAQL